MSTQRGKLLSALSSAELDTSLARAAQTTMEAATTLNDMSDWALIVLTEDNLSAGLLVVRDPSGVRPMSQAEFEQYRTYFEQVGEIAKVLTEGDDPPVGLVKPWWSAYRGPVSAYPGLR